MTSLTVLKRMLFANLLRPMLPLVGGFAISSDGYFFYIKFIRLDQKNIGLAHSLTVPTLFLVLPDKLDIKGHKYGIVYIQ